MYNFSDSLTSSENSVPVIFDVTYYPKFEGDRPRLVGSLMELGTWNHNKGIEAKKMDNSFVWRIEMNLPANSFFYFNWFSFSNTRKIQMENTGSRKGDIGAYGGNISTVYGDTTSSFISRAGCNVEITTHYILNYNERIGIVGSGSGLGNWQADAAIIAVKFSWGYWTVRVELERGQRHEYKWVVIDKDSKTIIRWQEGENRVIEIETGLMELKMNVPWTEGIIEVTGEANRGIEIEAGLKEVKMNVPLTEGIIEVTGEENRKIEIEAGLMELKIGVPWTEEIIENRQINDRIKELKIDVDNKEIDTLSK
ncbi:hypothetical protein SNE40_006624 [Patella caerulea]|uniref:CBM20 domain-containing protein n=1 Tax=Patella caerulea TaxID=87958 RepID=A0AAN8Q198_PATCE